MGCEKPHITTKFWVEGDELKPDELTRLIGIQPTRSGEKGELSPYPAARQRGKMNSTSFWGIEIERDSLTIEEGIQEILSLIWDRREVVVDYLENKPTVDASVLLVVHYSDNPPKYEVSRDSVQKLAALGISFGMDDIYRSDVGDTSSLDVEEE